MILRLFKGTGPGVVLLISLTMILLWVGVFIEPPMTVINSGISDSTPLYNVLLKIFGTNQIAGNVFSLGLVICMVFLLVGFNTSVFFINERTFLPALFYILLNSIFRQHQMLNPALPAAIFLILAIMRIMDSYRKQGFASNFFDAGLLISTGTLFYSDLIWFALIIFLGMISLRRVNLSEIFAAITGLVTPLLITAGIYFILEKDPVMFLSGIFKGLLISIPALPLERFTMILLIIVAVIVLISLFHLLAGINSKKIKSRKTFNILIWTLIFSVTLYFTVPSISTEIMWLASIPASYLLSHYFVFTAKKTITRIIFTGLFIFFLLVQLMYFI